MDDHPPRTWSEHLGTALLWLVSGLTLLFLVLPILAIIPLSFNSSSFLTYPLDGLSLRWYVEVLASERWINAARNTLIVGGASTAAATTLGTLAAVGLAHARFPLRTVVMGLLVSPMIVPLVITGVGVYFFFAPLGLTNTFLGLILVHTALATPFVVITVAATLKGFDPSLMRAAASFGAPPATAFVRVMLPLILPGVASGALFAFALSFDEVIVVLLVAGPEQRTLPREMFSGIRENVSPAITAVATMMILVGAALLASLEALRRRTARLRRGTRAAGRAVKT